MIAHTSPIEHALLAMAGAGAVLLYGLCWLRGPSRPTAQLAAWVGGVVTVLIATASPVENAAAGSFTGHMVQHLLLIVVAAPLLVLARPGRTFRAGWGAPTPTPAERRLARWWRSAAAFPAAGFFAATLYITHLTPVYDLALQNRFLHDVEHVAYLGAAVMLWAALRSGARLSAAARTGAVFAVIASSALLGVVLLSASSPLIPTYVELLGDGALADQRRAASLMWVGGMATTLPLLLLSVWSWAGAEQRVALRKEALQDAEARLRHAPGSESPHSPVA